MDHSGPGMNLSGAVNGWPPMFALQQTGQPPTGMPNGLPSSANQFPMHPNPFNHLMPSGLTQPQHIPNGVMPQLSSTPSSAQSPTSQFPPQFSHPQQLAQQPTGMPSFPHTFSQVPNGYPGGGFSGSAGSGAGGSGYAMPSGMTGAGGMSGMSGMPGMPSGLPQGMDPAMMQQMWMWQMQMQAMAMQQQLGLPTSMPQPTREDDVELAKALAEMHDSGRTLRQILEDFADSKKQSAAGWKDYYLTHKPRLDALADKYTARTTCTEQHVEDDPPMPAPVPPASTELTASELTELTASSTGQLKTRVTAKKPTFGAFSSADRGSNTPEAIQPVVRHKKVAKPESTKVSLSGESASSAKPQLPKEKDKVTRAEPAPRPRASLPSFKKSKNNDMDPPSAKRTRLATATGESTAASAVPRDRSTSASAQTPITRSSAANPYGRRIEGSKSSTRAIPVAEPAVRLPELQRGIRIPPVPARSPTPPVGSANGRYTDEDREFFVLFIRYHLDRDPELTKGDLARMLHSKAPHHSENSWKSRWNSRQQDVADIIWNLAEEKRVPPSPTARSRGTRPPTSPLASSADMDDSEDIQNMNEAPTRQAKQKRTSRDESPSMDESGLEDSADEGLSDYDPEMGGAGSKLTEGDLHALAHYVASKPAKKWKYTMAKDRWLEMESLHPTRHAGAWQSHYKRNKRDVLELARRYRRRDARNRTGSATAAATYAGKPDRAARSPLSRDGHPSSDVPMDEDSNDETNAVEAEQPTPQPASMAQETVSGPTNQAAGSQSNPVNTGVADTSVDTTNAASTLASVASAASMSAKASLKERARRWQAISGDDMDDGPEHPPFSPTTPVLAFSPQAATPAQAAPAPIPTTARMQAAPAPVLSTTRVQATPVPIPTAARMQVARAPVRAQILQQRVADDPLLVMAKNALGQNGPHPAHGISGTKGGNKANGVSRANGASGMNGTNWAYGTNGTSWASGEKDMSMSPIDQPASEISTLRAMLGRR